MSCIQAGSVASQVTGSGCFMCCHNDGEGRIVIRKKILVSAVVPECVSTAGTNQYQTYNKSASSWRGAKHFDSYCALRKFAEN